MKLSFILKIKFFLIIIFYFQQSFAVFNKCPGSMIATYDHITDKFDCTCFNNRDGENYHIDDVQSRNYLNNNGTTQFSFSPGYQFFSCKEMDYMDNYDLPKKIAPGNLIFWFDPTDPLGDGHGIYNQKIPTIATNVGAYTNSAYENAYTDPTLFYYKTKDGSSLSWEKERAYTQLGVYNQNWLGPNPDTNYINFIRPDCTRPVLKWNTANKFGLLFDLGALKTLNRYTIFVVFIDNVASTDTDPNYPILSLLRGNNDNYVTLWRRNFGLTVRSNDALPGAFNANSSVDVSFTSELQRNVFHLAIINTTTSSDVSGRDGMQIFVDPAPYFHPDASRLSGYYPRYPFSSALNRNDRMGSKNGTLPPDPNLEKFAILSTLHSITKVNQVRYVMVGVDNVNNTIVSSLNAPGSGIKPPGGIGEILIYNKELDPGQRMMIADHLREKWGIVTVDPKWW